MTPPKIREDITSGTSLSALTAKIARDLFVSVKTVEAHRQRIFQVLEIRNPAELIRWANDQGLLALMGWNDTKVRKGGQDD